MGGIQREPNGVRVLRHLLAAPNGAWVRMRDITTAGSFKPGSVSTVIRALPEGIVERAYEPERDRVTAVRLTADGYRYAVRRVGQVQPESTQPGARDRSVERLSRSLLLGLAGLGTMDYTTRDASTIDLIAADLGSDVLTLNLVSGALRGAGLVTVQPSQDDYSIKIVELTGTGRAVTTVLSAQRAEDQHLTRPTRSRITPVESRDPEAEGHVDTARAMILRLGQTDGPLAINVELEQSLGVTAATMTRVLEVLSGAELVDLRRTVSGGVIASAELSGLGLIAYDALASADRTAPPGNPVHGMRRRGDSRESGTAAQDFLTDPSLDPPTKPERERGRQL